MDIINNRRSIRQFTDKAVEDEKIEKLLKAGMQAPSAGNQQPWEFVVVKNHETRKKLASIGPFAKPAEKAPVNIVVLGNTKDIKYIEMIDQDLSACVQNILLEATHLNLGSLWMGVKPIKDRMDIISETLSLPEHLEPFALLAIGYSDIENNFVDRYKKEKVYFEKYNND